jgi:hypothetical protein
VPEYESIEYTWHALEQMRTRRIDYVTVELVLRHGEGRPGRHGKWIFELSNTRVVVVEFGSSARIITVIRLKGKS